MKYNMTCTCIEPGLDFLSGFKVVTQTREAWCRTRARGQWPMAMVPSIGPNTGSSTEREGPGGTPAVKKKDLVSLHGIMCDTLVQAMKGMNVHFLI